MNKNKESTRYYSDAHEKSVCKALGAKQQNNSGAGLWQKGDVIIEDADFLIECKTCMKDKDSVSIKKEWIEKNKEEAFAVRKSNQAICFNFGPNQSNYYIINEKLMKYLVEKIEEENEE
ncbi:hypothetical protein [uncultured Clostridium sp.]|uniref:hypothetical protein n=1 Tax=uncultured Clostridium sp. TaxID=59620 RepID=UPI00262E83D7|nr:hypothetical protein [uncultured Clostridium sp.]